MKYYLIAGEASGDMYGALLMRRLSQLDPSAQFRFWGGDAMQAVGGKPVRHIRDLSIMGFVEVAMHLGTVLGNLKFCKQDVLRFQPDVVIGIDYPGFNLKIEKWCKAHGIKAVHYISPNLWAWKKRRIVDMRKSLNALYYILPFEEAFFADNDMPQAHYVGHPLLDVLKAEPPRPCTGLPQGKPYIALLPGSRRQELKNMLPHMVHLASQHPEYHFVVAGMSLIGNEVYEKYVPRNTNITVVYDQTYSVLSMATAAVVCSGTATLETALFDVPQVVCYRANSLSVAIARLVVSRRIRYISLVNLIADAPIVTELIQGDCSHHRLEHEFQRITTDEANRERMLNEYADMCMLLGGGGASDAVAHHIHSLVR